MEQNITFRTKSRNNNSTLNESIPDMANNTFTSISSSSPTLAKSLPDLSTYDTGLISDLRSKIKELELQLASAHNEIEQLLLQKSILDQKVANLEKRINQLTVICTSTSKKRIKTNVQRPNSLRTLQFENSMNSTTLNMEDEVELSRKCKQFEEKEIHDSTLQTNNNYKPSENSYKIVNGNSKNTCWILGGQQCVGLASQLIYSRKNTKYEQYSVTSSTKPNASTEQILKESENLKAGNRDKIVVCIGENDTNPIIVTNELYNLLKKFKSVRVLVLSVIKSTFLNENMLNKQIKLICNQFPNSTYVDLSKSINIYQICDRVNYEIDCIDYKHKYLSYGKISERANQLKKGTIPFYFKQINTKVDYSKKKDSTKNVKQSPSLCNTSENMPKVGTIPFYFQKKTGTKNVNQLFRK